MRLRWKVYDYAGKYVASCRYMEDAAAVISSYSKGATIRDGARNRRVVWTEGVDGIAGQSYDNVADAIERRLEEWKKAAAV